MPAWQSFNVKIKTRQKFRYLLGLSALYHRNSMILSRPEQGDF